MVTRDNLEGYVGKYKTIGILGGMGPGASADLYQKIISYMQNRYQAVQDYDFPPIIVYNLPVWGFSERGFVHPQLVRKQLIDASLYLEKAGVDVIAIACNTVHHFHADIQESLSVPVINIIDEVVDHLVECEYKKVGVLTSQSTRDLGLYQKTIEGQNIQVVSARIGQQDLINKIILRVMSGRHNQSDVVSLKEIILDYKSQGIEAVILGCTELPLVFNQLYTDVPVVDATQILAEQTAKYSVKK